VVDSGSPKNLGSEKECARTTNVTARIGRGRHRKFGWPSWIQFERDALVTSSHCGLIRPCLAKLHDDRRKEQTRPAFRPRDGLP